MGWVLTTYSNQYLYNTKICCSYLEQQRKILGNKTSMLQKLYNFDCLFLGICLVAQLDPPDWSTIMISVLSKWQWVKIKYLLMWISWDFRLIYSYLNLIIISVFRPASLLFTYSFCFKVIIFTFQWCRDTLATFTLQCWIYF